MNVPGPIYDPDEAERLMNVYMEHGDLMGWGEDNCAMSGPGPIYDPDEAEQLIDTYLEHGDLMGWGDKAVSSKLEDCEQEEHGDE